MQRKEAKIIQTKHQDKNAQGLYKKQCFLFMEGRSENTLDATTVPSVRCHL